MHNREKSTKANEYYKMFQRFAWHQEDKNDTRHTPCVCVITPRGTFWILPQRILSGYHLPQLKGSEKIASTAEKVHMGEAGVDKERYQDLLLTVFFRCYGMKSDSMPNASFAWEFLLWANNMMRVNILCKAVWLRDQIWKLWHELPIFVFFITTSFKVIKCNVIILNVL